MKKSFFVRILPTIGLALLILFAYFLYVDFDVDKLLYLIKNIVFIFLPSFLICELFSKRFISRRIENDYEVNLYRHKILALYEFIDENEAFNDFLYTYLYVMRREEVLYKVNDAIYESGYNNFLKSLGKFDFKRNGTWFLSDANKFKESRLFSLKDKATIDIVAFSFSFVSLLIVLAGFVNFTFSWWQIIYLLLPVVVETISYFWSGDSYVVMESHFLLLRKQRLDLIKSHYDANPKAWHEHKEREDKLEKEIRKNQIYY